MQHQWLRWTRGYVVVMLKGMRMERLINIATQRKMQIWNISRFDDQHGRMTISLPDFYRLRPLLKETGCRARILSKHGLPFYVKRIRKRHAFFIGFVGFLSMLFLLSNVIWTVEIIGADRVSETQVFAEAKKLGVEQGKFRFMLDDPDKIQAQLMSQIEEASWVGFQMKGTRAEIRIVEKVIPEARQTVHPRHLVAKKSAVVHDIFAAHGRPLVRPDDFVRKGDILVSGFIGKEDSPVAVMAQGKVEGEVWYETEVVVPIERSQTVYTGEKHRNFYAIIGDKQIKLWGFGEVSFTEHETKENSRLFAWGERTFNIGWKTEDLLATEEKVVTIDVEKARNLAIEAAKKDVLSKMDQAGYIKDEKVLLQREENDKVYIKLHVVAIEDIAIEQPIYLEGD